MHPFSIALRGYRYVHRCRRRGNEGHPATRQVCSGHNGRRARSGGGRGAEPWRKRKGPGLERERAHGCYVNGESRKERRRENARTEETTDGNEEREKWREGERTRAETTGKTKLARDRELDGERVSEGRKVEDSGERRRTNETVRGGNAHFLIS